jgi:hypothetical protein
MTDINEIRELLNSADPNQVKIPNWKVCENIGAISNFNGTQAIIFDAVGMGPVLDHVQISTHDTRNGTTTVSRWIVISHLLVADLLMGLLQAEAGVADLEVTDRTSWPEMPILVAEVEGQGQNVKIHTDFYRGYLEVRLSRPKTGGVGQWQKFRTQDIRPAARLILKAHDAIVAAMDGAPPSMNPYQVPIPF